jgi:chemotaxis response regulator CheB
VQVRRVLILCEPGLLAQAMRTLLESDPRIEIVGVTSDARRAGEIIRQTKPAAILVDADHFSLGLNHARRTISIEGTPALIALSQDNNMIHICRMEERALTAPEDLIDALSV